MKYYLLIFLIIAAGCTPQYTGPKDEKYYQTIWCDKEGGKIEYVLDDSTRVDCLLPSYAVEVDWDYKWAEGVGQAQYYAIKTGRKPGLLLIKDKDGERFIKRAKISGTYSDIKIWVIKK